MDPWLDLAADLPDALPARPPQDGLANLEGSLEAAGDRPPPDQREGPVALRPSLEVALERVLDLGLPASWDHGDFWVGNVTRGGVFFDLLVASATHPFVSLPWFLDDLPEGLDAGRLLEAYLDGWADVAPIGPLRGAYRASAPLAHLHAADFYARTLPPSLEARWEMVGMLPHYLGRAASAPT